jgi:LuxR family transcriptional activator of bioluminescence operon
MMQAVAKHGFSEGLSLPMRGGDGRLGLVALAGDRGPLGVLEQEFLRIVSASAFAAMDRIRNAHVEIDLAPNFSQRELSCLWLLARGLSYDEIAVSLDLSERTVRFHLANASDKAGAKSRTHLVSIVTRQGWIDP